MNTRTTASATLVASAGFTSTPVSPAKAVVAGEAAEAEPEPDAGLRARSRRSPATAWKPMSLVSSSTGMMPAPSKATLNLRGRP